MPSSPGDRRVFHPLRFLSARSASLLHRVPGVTSDDIAGLWKDTPLHDNAMAMAVVAESGPSASEAGDATSLDPGEEESRMVWLPKSFGWAVD